MAHLILFTLLFVSCCFASLLDFISPANHALFPTRPDNAEEIALLTSPTSPLKYTDYPVDIYQFDFEDEVWWQTLQLPASRSLPHLIHQKGGYRRFYKSSSTPDRPLKLVIYFHGNKETTLNFTRDALEYIDRGYEVLAVEFPRYGFLRETYGWKSHSIITQKRVMASARACLRRIIQKYRNGNTLDIVLQGYSMGTGLAVDLAYGMIQANNHFSNLRFKLRAIVLEAPYNTIRNAAKIHISHFKSILQYLIANHLNNIKKIISVNVPTLYLIGKKDPKIPHYLSEELFRKHLSAMQSETERDQIRMIFDPEGTHRLRRNHEQEIYDFVDEQFA